MALSVFDMFSIGIGPSSSHTVGPMRAARSFGLGLAQAGQLTAVRHIRAELFGSLGHTGRGHGSDRAVLLGLEGEEPDVIDPDVIDGRVARIRDAAQLNLMGSHAIAFDERRALVFHRRKSLPRHPNGMRFTAYGDDDSVVEERVYYSVGGGFVVGEDVADEDPVVDHKTPVPYPFSSGTELLALCHEHGIAVSTLMLRNETARLSEDEVRAGLLRIWQVMESCVDRGCEREGILPGGLRVKRRAASLHRRLKSDAGSRTDPLAIMDWVNLYALAVNEENASGGRVVTAPTNGAAGVIPAVLSYYQRFSPGADEDGTVRFLLTAGAIGIIYKSRASISGAEVGCQGEVGVACSMAAGALAEVGGGTPDQVENAAEIGMEHNLGLTCDPVGGLVQVPCIERNAMGAVKAINAARLALHGDGQQKVSLDKVIETMRQTGADMKTKYKETARGGLAVNIIEC
jgi:L-serine dehydratase